MNLKKIKDSLIKDNVILAVDEDDAIQQFIDQGYNNVEVEETGEVCPKTGKKEFRLISDTCGGKKRKKVKDSEDLPKPKRNRKYDSQYATDIVFGLADKYLSGSEWEPQDDYGYVSIQRECLEEDPVKAKEQMDSYEKELEKLKPIFEKYFDDVDVYREDDFMITISGNYNCTDD